MAEAAAVPAARAIPESAFLRELVTQLRAQDGHGVWDGKPDAALLAPYVVTREQRRALPIIADPDPDILWRLELFYNAHYPESHPGFTTEATICQRSCWSRTTS